MTDTLGLFTDSGGIGQLRTQKGPLAVTLPAATSMPELKGLPIVVLTGPITEGWAEIFVALLRERNAARVVGLATAGRTEIQDQLKLSDGSMLFITVGVYELPNGTLVGSRGVQPDRRVDGAPRADPLQDEQLKAALDELSK